MGTVHCRDPRTGIVYVYSSESYWDKETKTTKARRKLIGKMDENGNMIPTNGKPGRPRKQKTEAPKESQGEQDLRQEMERMKETYEQRIKAQTERISELESKIRSMEREEKSLAESLEKILARMAARKNQQ